MRRSQLLAVAVLAVAAAFPAHAQDTNAELADRLKTAFVETDEQARVEAIEAAAGVKDQAVIAGVAKGLRDRSLAVREAAIKALGGTDHPDALKALHALYKSDTKLRDDEALFALLTKEIGRHGDMSSLPVLRDKPFKGLTKEVGRARIMAASRLRSIETVEALFEGARKGGGTARRGGGRFRDSGYEGMFWSDFRVAIAVLTGRDPGRDKDEALMWWQKNKDSVKVAETRPEIPEPLVAQWEEYWEEPYRKGGARPAPASRFGPPHPLIENPDDATVKEAVDGLKEGLRSSDPEERAAAIETYGYVVDDAVIREVAKALRDKDDRVRLEAIDALGWSSSEDALKQLHRLYQRDKKLRDDETVFTHLLKAIGRHRDDSSVTVLSDSPFKGLTISTGQARIFGLGNIRSNDSIEELIKGMRLGGSDPRGGKRVGKSRFMVDMRVALYVLTGVDHGESKEAWQDWWRDNKKSFRVSPERPNVPQSVKTAWETYWNQPY